jgi:hypothetical protein
MSSFQFLAPYGHSCAGTVADQIAVGICLNPRTGGTPEIRHLECLFCGVLAS